MIKISVPKIKSFETNWNVFANITKNAILVTLTAPKIALLYSDCVESCCVNGFYKCEVPPFFSVQKVEFLDLR